jgi:hypothetical protein
VPSPRRGGAGGGGASRSREILLVVLVAAVVVLAALAGPFAARFHEPPAWTQWQGQLPTDQPTLQPMASAPPLAQSEPADLHGLGRVLAWLGIALLVALAAFLVRRAVLALLERWRAIDRGRRAAAASGGAVTDDELDEAARAALDEGVAQAGRALRDDLPPGDAVVAAWLALEHAAQRCGVERDPAQTASEFTVALLDRTPADPRAARTLLRLYHAARFSDHVVGPADVAAARVALATLATALGQVAAEAAAAADDEQGATAP